MRSLQRRCWTRPGLFLSSSEQHSYDSTLGFRRLKEGSIARVPCSPSQIYGTGSCHALLVWQGRPTNGVALNFRNKSIVCCTGGFHQNDVLMRWTDSWTSNFSERVSGMCSSQGVLRCPNAPDKSANAARRASCSQKLLGRRCSVGHSPPHLQALWPGGAAFCPLLGGASKKLSF